MRLKASLEPVLSAGPSCCHRQPLYTTATSDNTSTSFFIGPPGGEPTVGLERWRRTPAVGYVAGGGSAGAGVGSCTTSDGSRVARRKWRRRRAVDLPALRERGELRDAGRHREPRI